MTHEITIPTVADDARIGSCFNYLLQVAEQTEQAQGEVAWDFSSASFLHPFFVSALAVYRLSCGRQIRVQQPSPGVRGYLDSIHFASPFKISSVGDVVALARNHAGRSYIPLCEFPSKGTLKDQLQSLVRELALRHCTEPRAVTSPLSLMVSELIDNISEHSESPSGYIFSQYLERERCVDICIADTGVTIAGRFERSGLYPHILDGNEAAALRLANEGTSTKARPQAENRGYGIPSSKRILVDGLGGSFFILSGGAFHRYERREGTAENYYADISDFMRWRGTIILLRVPVDTPEGFDFYKYLD